MMMDLARDICNGGFGPRSFLEYKYIFFLQNSLFYHNTCYRDHVHKLACFYVHRCVHPE